MSGQSTVLPNRLARFSLADAAQRVFHALLVRKSRQRLAQLDAHMLADIGLTPAQARLEADRAPWDAPQSWRKPC